MQKLRDSFDDLFSQELNKRKRNQEDAYDPDKYHNRLIGGAAATFVGYGLILIRTVTLSTGVLGAPAFGASIIGLPITFHFWLYFSRGLRDLMSQQSPLIRMPVMFLFHASMAILSGFIGLAIVAACTSALAVNPFVLPCLIAVSLASAIVLSASIAVACRTQYIVHKNEPTSKNLFSHVWQVIWRDGEERHLRADTNKNGESRLIVVPFGQEDNERPELEDGYEVRSIPKLLSSFFDKKRLDDDTVTSGAKLDISSGSLDIVYN